LCERAEEYSYSSASAGIELDPVPQGLKPIFDAGLCGAAEAAPFQSNSLQSKVAGKVEASSPDDNSGKIAS